MRYTPAQLKEALELTEERLRYWRRELTQLKGRRGYSPCFTPGDLLALKVVAELAMLGVQISTLKLHAEDLFNACSRNAWFGLENKVLVFDGRAMEMVSLSEEGGWVGQTRIAVPMGPLIRQLRQRLSEEDSVVAQPEIAFPPVEVAQGRSK